MYDESASDEGNIITKSQIAAAKAKGWTSYYTTDNIYWYEYEGMDDEAAGIAKTTTQQTAEDEAVYTLSGARVKNLAKGLYIKNGRKVVVK